MNFYPIEGELGHNVPIHFQGFLNQFGGYEVSGRPISEVMTIATSVYQQCFANLCLVYDLNLPVGEQLKLSPIGIKYKELVFDPMQSFSESQSFDNLEIRLWENTQNINQNDSQTISVAISDDGIPLRNREPVLIIDIPGGIQRKMVFPPTGDDGQTSLQVQPISASPLTLISYTVCLSNLNGNTECKRDNFQIN
jgi:hypothetical protein